MTIAIAAIVPTLVACLIALAVWSRRLKILDRVVVSLKSGNAVGGVIANSTSVWITLADAEVYDVDSPTPTPADGLIWLERKNVDYIQALSGRR